MTYYTTKKVLEIMENYQTYKQAIQCFRKEYASVGVAMGGIESVMPKAQGGTSDVVANEALRQIETTKYHADIQTDMKYLEDRLDRVTDSIEIEILALRMEGHSIRDIASITLYSKSHVHRMLERI